MSYRTRWLIGLSLVLAFGWWWAVALIQPVYAAENSWQAWSSGLRSRFERLYLQLWPGEKPGAMVLRQVLTANQQLRSFYGDTTIQVELPATSATPGTIQVTAKGPTVLTQLWDPRTVQQDLQLDVQANLAPQTWQLTAQLRQLDGQTYFQLSQLPPELGLNLPQLANTWIKVPASAPPALNPVQEAELQAAYRQLFTQAQVSPARAAQLGEHQVYVLTVTLPRAAVVTYLDTVQRLSQAAPETASSGWADEAAAMEQLSAQLWVDQQSYFIRQVELPLQLRLPATASPLTALPGLAMPGGGLPSVAEIPSQPVPTMPAPAESVPILIRTLLDQHNQTFVITAPAAAQDIQQLLLPRLTGMPAGSPPAGLVSPAPPAGRRLPTVGTTELPALTPEQQRVLDEYEQMMGRSYRLPE